MLQKLEIAAIYAGVNVLLLLVLAVMTVAARMRYKVMLGDNGNAHMARAIRVHANAAEYIPAGIAGLAVLALMEPVPVWMIHAVGAGLTLGRILHAWGLSASAGPTPGRGLGMVLTWTAYGFLGAGLIWAGIEPLLR